MELSWYDLNQPDKTSQSGASKISSLIGKLLMVDKNIENEIGLNFAWLSVKIEMDGQLPGTIFFKMKEDEKDLNLPHTRYQVVQAGEERDVLLGIPKIWF
ncbi:hypothetical protein H5410_002527 [Solanum commersonii]|uniref:Uncharacterized protein n=1 Tax=Solanum commersonii TaxID=4109 RepID=A0A9J6B2J6_SOLCO|nr:hypothetical protein H5410_002527 [Solanum commersonii]